MKRRQVLTLVLVGNSILRQPALAEAAKLYRIGMLFATGPLPEHAGFYDTLRDLGYSEGRGLVIERRYCEGHLERLPEFAAGLARMKVDIIVTSSTPAALAAKSATSTIPIVLAIAGDAVAAGLVASLARPGGNITGLSFLGPEVIAKSMQLLRDALPGLTRFVFVSGSAFLPDRLVYQRLQAIAPGLGVHVELADISAAEGPEPAFATMVSKRTEAVVVSQAAFGVHGERILELVRQHRLPAAFGSREGADRGGLMAYGPNRFDLYRRAAQYVGKILKGAKPADLPVEQPTKFELVVNLKTAKAIGLMIPQSPLLRADEVIQ